MKLLRSYEKRVFKLRSFLFDRDNLTLSEARLAKLTQLDPAADLMLDRRQEFAEYYGITEAEAGNVESIRDKQSLEDHFNAVETDNGLLRNYRDASFLYTARLMMAYTRFPTAWKLVQYLNSLYPPGRRTSLRLLDYGCGAADYALAFATQGYQITLCDIEGGNLDFAKRRFERRNIPINVLPVREDDLYPALPPHNIVLSGELFEHIREPLLALRNIHDCLPKGGIFWHSGYPEVEREVGGDHLPEAAEQRLEALNFLREHFKPATALPLPGYLYKKR
jgi:SAM-dependent methyltransferase